MAEEKINNNDMKALRNDYKKIFETEEGQRVMAHMEKVGFFKETTFVAGDPNSTIFNEGVRYFLLNIKAVLELDIEQLEKLVDAAQKNRS